MEQRRRLSGDGHFGEAIIRQCAGKNIAAGEKGRLSSFSRRLAVLTNRIMRSIPQVSLLRTDESFGSGTAATGLSTHFPRAVRHGISTCSYNLTRLVQAMSYLCEAGRNVNLDIPSSPSTLVRFARTLTRKQKKSPRPVEQPVRQTGGQRYHRLGKAYGLRFRSPA